MWPKNILYLLLNDLYLILWGIPIKNNSHFKTCINCLFLKESAPFIAKFLIAIEVRFVKRGSPPAIRWTVSRTCSDLSCRMITSPSNWSISPRSLDWTTKVYCSLTSKNINLYCYQSFHFFLNSLIFFLPLSIKQSGVWNALMSSTDCPAWFGNQRRGCLLFHFFCKHRTSLEKNKENKKKNWIIREIAYLKSEEFGKILCLSPCGPELTSATKVFWLIYLTLLPFFTLLRIQKENFYEFSKYWG